MIGTAGLFDSIMPAGMRYQWCGEILWRCVASDTVLAFSCLSVLAALLHCMYKSYNVTTKLVYMVCMGIASCGHRFGIWAGWRGQYVIQVVFKALTAFESIITVVLLVPAIPSKHRVAGLRVTVVWR